MLVCPVPEQVGHTRGVVPALAPVPEHARHGCSLVIRSGMVCSGKTMVTRSANQPASPCAQPTGEPGSNGMPPWVPRLSSSRFPVYASPVNHWSAPFPMTVVASLAPAYRATRVAPIQALRDPAPEPVRFSSRRLATGLLVTVAGVAGLHARQPRHGQPLDFR